MNYAHAIPINEKTKKNHALIPAPFGFWKSNFIFLFLGLALFYLLLFINSVLHIEIFCENEIDVLLKGFPFGLCLLSLIAITIKNSGRSVQNYFALYWPEKWDVCVRLPWVAAIVVTLILLLHHLFDHESHWTSAIYAYAQHHNLLPLLYLRVVLEAPLVEELTFRGFLYKGWAATRLKCTGGILLISLVFGIIHTQYNLIGMLQCMIIGLALGYLRARSGTVVLPILFHALWNAGVLGLSGLD